MKGLYEVMTTKSLLEIGKSRCYSMPFATSNDTFVAANYLIWR